MTEIITALDKLKRARIEIQKKSPFFAYLSLYLQFREDKSNQLEKFAGMGVSADGVLIYKAEFVENLNRDELMGVLIHEILHLALLHLTRRKRRQPLVWNIACDLCVNHLVKQNNFSLPDGCVIADYNDEFNIKNIVIKDVSKKTAELIYEELEKLIDKNKSKWVLVGNNGYPQNKDDDGENPKGFDIHIESKEDGKGKGKGKDKDKNGNGTDTQLTEEEKKEIEDKWTQLGKEALVYSKLKGNMPNGMERLIGELTDNKVAWRSILQKYIQRAIPYDYTYANPSKKSMATGYYMPSTIKEYVDVVIAVDTSGSIGEIELKEFLSEIIGIAKSFSSRVKMRLLTHDTKVWDDYLVQNGNIEKIKALKIRGGGGTSHKEVFEYVDEKIRDTKLLICFTDGDSDLQEIETGKFKYDKLFVISENGHDGQLQGKNDVHILKLGDYKYEEK
jgi:predicted metal-dependent peptidase